MSTRVMTTLTLVIALAATPLYAQTEREIAAQFRAAEHKAEVEGDLPGAIAEFQTLTEVADRGIAAEALIHIGRAYERLGSAEAQIAYTKILNEYADQTEPAREARLRLDALLDDGAEVADASGPRIRRVWEGPGAFPYFGRVSRDGRYYAHAVWGENGAGNLAVRELATGETRVLIASEGPVGLPYYALISPDHSEVVYAWWHAPNQPLEVGIVAMDGSSRRVLIHGDPELGWLELFDWSADGSAILAAVQRPDRTAQIVLLSPSDGSTRVLKSLGWRWPGNMSFSPDSRFIAYDLNPDADTREFDIFVLATDGSQEFTLVEHEANDHLPFWTPDGRSVIFASDRTGNVDMWRKDVVAGRPAGEAELIQRDVPYDPRGLSAAGHYYYLSDVAAADVYLATLDETGRISDEPRSLNPDSVGRVGAFDWSPDGRFLVYTRRSQGSRNQGGEELVVRDLATGQERDVMPDELAFVDRPMVSRDGQRILVFATPRRDPQGTYVIEDGEVRPTGITGPPLGWSADGELVYGFEIGSSESVEEIRAFATRLENSERTELLRLVSDAEEFRLFARDPEAGIEKEVLRASRESVIDLPGPAVSPDGRFLTVLADYASAQDTAIVVAPMSGEVRELELPGNNTLGMPAVSPDGRFLAFPAKAESGRSAMMVIPIAGGDIRELDLPGTNPVGPPVWTPDSSGLLFMHGEGARMRSLRWLSLDEGVTEPLGLAMEGLGGIRIHPDGRQLKFSAGPESDFQLWAMEDFLR